jgi:hypothetical protein
MMKLVLRGLMLTRIATEDVAMAVIACEAEAEAEAKAATKDAVDKPTVAAAAEAEIRADARKGNRRDTDR